MNIKFRPHKREDIPLRVKWMNDPRVIKYLGFDISKKVTKKTASKWFDEYEKESRKGTKKFFLVLDNKKPIGLVGLSRIHKIDGSTDLFIIIGDKDYVGKGISKTMMNFIVHEYGFGRLDLHKINLGVFTDNKIAVNLYKKMGFKIEGTLKDEKFFGGRYHDLYSMAIFNKKK
uniref:N-acetyltransferase n=1 Tax=candidate division CPR3 bacterium TaxID=2268181 RepID=A0A7C4RAJ8_UNCC3